MLRALLGSARLPSSPVTGQRVRGASLVQMNARAQGGVGATLPSHGVVTQLGTGPPPRVPHQPVLCLSPGLQALKVDPCCQSREEYPVASVYHHL